MRCAQLHLGTARLLAALLAACGDGAGGRPSSETPPDGAAEALEDAGRPDGAVDPPSGDTPSDPGGESPRDPGGDAASDPEGPDVDAGDSPGPALPLQVPEMPRCSGDPAYCCTPDRCARFGTVCNPESCRCEHVPCAVDGAPCDPSLFPEPIGDAVCARTAGGLACVVRLGDGAGDCPDALHQCFFEPGYGGCLCGGTGCRFFSAEDDCPGPETCGFGDCPDPSQCGLDEAPPGGLGACRPWQGNGREGESCYDEGGCVEGLVCGSYGPWYGRCVRPTCGMAEGGPCCAPGAICQPVDATLQVGVCITACDPLDPDSPCQPEAYCAPRELEPGVPAGAGCFDAGWGALPSAGEPCDSHCRPGYACIAGVCLEACDPARPDNTGSAACSSGDCVDTGLGSWVGDPFACAVPCDGQADPTEACPADRYCTPTPFGTTDTPTYCLPSPYPGLDEWCWDACRPGLVCADRCRPVCELGAAGDGAGCPADEHCFQRFEDDGSMAQVGFCDVPCTPGGADCPVGSWCQPREIDPATGLWMGRCIRWP